jgi:hypothetical protein
MQYSPEIYSGDMNRLHEYLRVTAKLRARAAIVPTVSFQELFLKTTITDKITD